MSIAEERSVSGEGEKFQRSVSSTRNVCEGKTGKRERGISVLVPELTTTNGGSPERATRLWCDLFATEGRRRRRSELAIWSTPASSRGGRIRRKKKKKTTDLGSRTLDSTFGGRTWEWTRMQRMMIGKDERASRQEDCDTEKLLTTSSESEDGELRRKVRRRKTQEYNPEVDNQNPVFCAGLLFPTGETLKWAIKEYAIKHRRDVKLVKNDKKRIRARCQSDCSWQLYAAVERFLGQFQANPSWNEAGLKQVLGEVTKVDVTKWKFYKTRRIAQKIIEGSMKEQHAMLGDYYEELRSANPGSRILKSLKFLVQEKAGSSAPQPSWVPLHSHPKYKTRSANK
ncbi:hypothetical protein TIFTF001_003220 [Ficus carica]|uniref:Transposase MuDR plant domain-containing protein n=1 Tax=Ficus carica TaxID=3494 RepID=A0AA88CQW3_FICCA|nr:hypothetical protein TIFTF001_003220 [Ficus carica]